MAWLTAAGSTAQRPVFVWDGRTPAGDLAPPGIYLLRIRLDADAHAETVLHLVHLVY